MSPGLILGSRAAMPMGSCVSPEPGSKDRALFCSTQHARLVHWTLPLAQPAAGLVAPCFCCSSSSRPGLRRREAVLAVLAAAQRELLL